MSYFAVAIACFIGGSWVGFGIAAALSASRHADDEKTPSAVMQERLNADEERAREDRARRKAEEERQFDNLMQYKGIKQ